jgi:hypothetical protein
MKRRNPESSSLATRLSIEYETLRIIDERRLREANPQLGKAVEERIIERTLDELEA